MKKTIITALLFLAINTSSANTGLELPDDIAVREHWISLTKSYDIETNSHKLGTLYRRFFSFTTTYDFYDPMEVKTATATARFFSFGTHLDIYDQANMLLGSVEEKIFTFFPTFEVIGKDSSTKLARAEMNFWGTKFYIYDPATNQEMALMSRSFFRLKDDWNIHVTNRDLLAQKNIDPRLLMTVLAVQGEIEEWKSNSKNYRMKAMTTNSSKSQPNQYAELIQQIESLSNQKNLAHLDKPKQENLEALADELDQQFIAENFAWDNQNPNDEERVKAFTSYCFNLVSSPHIPETKKKAILTLLNMRLTEAL